MPEAYSAVHAAPAGATASSTCRRHPVADPRPPAPRGARRDVPRRAAGAARRARSRCGPTTPSTGSAPTPRTPTSAATRPATPCWSIEDGEAVLYARPRSARDTDEFFRDRQYGELWVGRRPSLREISDSLGLEVPPHRPARGRRPRQRHRQDPGAARGLDRRRPPGPRRRVPRRGPRPGRLRGAAGQGRLGGRRAPGGLRHHHARVRGRRARVAAASLELRRALDRGHLLPPRPGDGQRHRLRLHRRRRPARDDAALDRQHRPDHAGRAGAARHGRRGRATSTPPT